MGLCGSSSGSRHTCTDTHSHSSDHLQDLSRCVREFTHLLHTTMKSVLGLVLLLTAPSYGLQSVCDATQDAVCYGALGGPVHLQLMRNTTGHELNFKNEKNIIFRIRSNGKLAPKPPSQRWEVVAGNGTLIINPAESTDSGTYRVDISGSDGIIKHHIVQLMIEATPLPTATSTTLVTTLTTTLVTTPPTTTVSMTTSTRLQSVCDATQDAVCYGALGGPVHLQLMRDTTGHQLTFKNEKNTIFRIRNRKLAPKPPSQRWEVVAGNGTLIINPAESTDSGTYRVEFSGSDGIIKHHTVQLMVEVPVSAVDLSITTSANGERKAWCFSNGDSPQYSWSLDGRALSGADADLSTDNQTVLLKGCNVQGKLTCTVSNHISIHTSAVLFVLSSGVCVGISPIFISVWLAEIIVLISLLVGGYYLHIRGRTTHTADEKQEVELTPTSMSRRRRRRSPEEVEVQ
ncbi:hypothetical protein ACEWY4_015584 [Coilia grayii]|uniref:Immunoglobulin domain-containing protein n=1 Tax=Coilia grayii TaxID=363190 RepID=A0ABD1JNE1_9TELE